ncbi:hypothetical protein H7K45_25725 [Mycobacterium yunnanensis]|uniref:Uncharacterized protein n=1 Tax=Mycobacterium yunnanensis TaxID=368477 RepID=A0A9X2YQV2_9MYCO|nr:hypothetical protein [Mycobacterium yunnanensis]MCV7423957.1 hypothetical protein [Mycobacterium yunnanensis]
MSLLDRLASALGEATTVVAESDGALTVTVDGMVASLRVVVIAEGLEMVSLTSPLAWDLPLSAEIRDLVAEQAGQVMLGTVTLVGKAADDGVADVMLRYNFPAAGLSEESLRTLILLVLTTGAEVRRTLIR